MPFELITLKDLQQFKIEFFTELKKLLGAEFLNRKHLLKSAEVMDILKASPGTLQNLRRKGTLKTKKIGGTLYYHRDDLDKLIGKRN